MREKRAETRTSCKHSLVGLLPDSPRARSGEGGHRGIPSSGGKEELLIADHISTVFPFSSPPLHRNRIGDGFI